ncbi:PAS domain S-box protein [bacterium]|nr:PAS domain S-box protein [bacterium]MBU1989897.1 PAS domain S-box protein [bacterium]
MEKEILINDKQMIVSQTDAGGRITYVNDVFCSIAGYKRDELMGKNHNIIRHPDVPRAVFKLLWDTLHSGQAIYAFVKNRVKNGDYYWVKAYVKPIMKNGILDYAVSYRKPVDDFAKETVGQIYASLVEYEKTHTVEESFNLLLEFLRERNLTYEQFINRLSTQKNVFNVEATNIDADRFHTDHILFKVNIIDKVKRGLEVEVADSCCCAFGKELEKLKGKSFTSHPSWNKLLQEHQAVHNHMRDYVHKAQMGASKNELQNILNMVESDTVEIFKNLNDVIDQSR